MIVVERDQFHKSIRVGMKGSVHESILLLMYLFWRAFHEHPLMLLSLGSMQFPPLLVKRGSTSFNCSISREVFVPDIPILVTLPQ